MAVKINESLVRYVDLQSSSIINRARLCFNTRFMSFKSILTVPFLIISIAGFSQLKNTFRENEEIAAMEAKAAGLRQETLMDPSNFSKASTNFDINYLDCKWNVDPGVRYIQGSVKTGFTITERTNLITFDLADELKVDSIRFRTGKITHYRPFDNTVIVNLGVFLDKGNKDAVEIFYRGIPPVTTPISSFTTSAHAGVPVLWTLSEPYGGRDWWPCKNGLNDKADSLDIAITTPDKYTSSTNGMLQSDDVVGGFRTTRWKHRYPIATYLVAFAATNYQVIQDQVKLGNTTMPIMEHAYPEKTNEFLNAAAITKRTLQLLHNSFTPYPFIKERYGHTQFGFGGGMEHQTNSFMQNMSETLIVHEAAHQWFGDKITCGSWKDIWLNEGYATFCTNLNIEKYYPEATLLNNYRSQINFITSRPNGSVYVDDTTSVSRIFDSRLTYNKGGWVLQMLRWKLGDSAFFRATRNYLNDPALAYGYAKTTDLKKHFEKEGATDLTEFFNDWVYGQGFPSYKLQWATGGGAWIQTTLSQTTSDTAVKFFEMPVPVRFKSAFNDTTVVLNHTKNAQVDFFKIGFVPDSVFIDPKYKIVSANNTVSKAEIFPGAGNVVVFPNPVQDEFSVLLKNMTEGVLNLSLYNTSGQLVWRQRFGNFSGTDLFIIPSSNLAPGNYWIRVNKDEDPQIIRRVIK